MDTVESSSSRGTSERASGHIISGMGRAEPNRKFW